MNPTQTDQLRDALRREIQNIEPVGLGVETVQRRGRGRRNRGRFVVALATATCVAGIGVAVTHHEGTHQLAVTASVGSGTAPALEFRTIAGTLGYTSTHFTTADGVTYELSTAPATVAPDNQPSQAIYRTTDDEHWTAADQGKPWIADLTEHDGVLYAVGTAPGATASDVSFRYKTSHDGGKAWTDSNLPFAVSAPNVTVPVTHAPSVQIARGTSATVALMTDTFWPNLDALVAAHAAGHPNAMTKQTDAGFDIVDLSECQALKESVLQAAGTPTTASNELKTKCTDPPVLGTIPWSEIGAKGAADLTRQEMLVTTDGTHWDHATAPATSFVRDLVADNDGFLLLAEDPTTATGPRPTMSTTLYRSRDAHSWTKVGTPTGLNVQAIAGSRVIGIDGDGTVQTSADGGATWHATAVSTRLPTGAPASSPSSADAGPLGFAVLTMANGGPNVISTPGHDYLLFSADGINWSTSDLAAAGAPPNAYPQQVTVGADHVSVTYSGTDKTSNGSLALTTLLGTPKR